VLVSHDKIVSRFWPFSKIAILVARSGGGRGVGEVVGVERMSVATPSTLPGL
jgi:hypothetical protein